MILLLDTSTPLARLTLIDAQHNKTDAEWQADRQLAKGLLEWIEATLQQQGTQWGDIEAIGILQGPGSFTGLRIGITVANTLAESLHVPIVGATGDAWQDIVIQRLQNRENDRVVLPYYDRDATITTQRK